MYADPRDVELGKVLLRLNLPVRELAVHPESQKEQNRKIDKDPKHPKGDVLKGSSSKDCIAGVAGHNQLDKVNQSDLEAWEHLQRHVQRLEENKTCQENRLVNGY